MKERRYSYSKLNTFISCPLKYRLTYIDRNKKKDQSIEAFFGIVMHECLEWIYSKKAKKYGQYFSLDHVTNKFKQIWEKNFHSNIRVFHFRKPDRLSGFISKKKIEYYSLGINSLVKFYSFSGPYFDSNTIKVEDRIRFDIDGHKFEGILDRVDLEDNSKIKVIDYKTGKKKLTDKKLSSDMQMGLYLHAVKSLLPDFSDESITMSHFYTRDCTEVSVKGTQIDTSKLADKVSETISAISESEQKGDFPEIESSLCNWCYYWKECSKKEGRNPSFYLE